MMGRGRQGVSRLLRTIPGIVLVLVLLATPVTAAGGSRTHSPPRDFRADGFLGSTLAASSVVPGGVIGSIQITVHNPMALATGVYQQPVRIHSASFSDLINSNWSNGVPFYTATGTPLYGWIETNASNIASQTLLWLKLDSIPANGWTNVSMYFLAKDLVQSLRDGLHGRGSGVEFDVWEVRQRGQGVQFLRQLRGESSGSAWLGGSAWTTTIKNGFNVTRFQVTATRSSVQRHTPILRSWISMVTFSRPALRVSIDGGPRHVESAPFART